MINHFSMTKRSKHLLEMVEEQKRLTRQDKHQNFEEILLAVIDQTLKGLGENVAVSTYFYLNKMFEIERQQIPTRIDDFSQAMAQIFGVGARSLEIMFMKNLYTKIGSTSQLSVKELPPSEITFKEYICLMKKIYKNKINKETVEFLINGKQEQLFCEQ